MGIELPAELADIAARTGVSWPEADEDAMREQAGAWRQAARELTTLAADADTVAGKALSAMTGPAAEAAGERWSGFVEPDHGRLTVAARGADEAANRLESAAEQVGAAKVEIVRQLVDAARNHDAAVAAADSGHPTALAGLDTALRGTATNVGAISGGLVDAVGPGANGTVHAVGDVVDPNPGTHSPDGQAGLLSTATGLPATVVDGALSPVGGPPGLSPVEALPADVVPLPERHRPEDVLPLPGERPLGDRAPEVPEVRSELPDVRPEPASPPVSVPDDVGTGPIALPGADAPTPPRGAYGGFLSPGGFDDVPTPPTGIAAPGPGAHGIPTPPAQTHLAGFSGGPAAPVPPPPAPILPPGQQFAGQPYAPQPFAGQQFGPAPYAGAAPGQAPMSPPMPPPGQAAGVAPAPPRLAPGVPAPPARWAPDPQPAPPAQPYPPQGRPPEPVRPQQPAAPVPLGAPRQERESIVALFRVHMFPIGHLPVAADRPARQLPLPDADADTAVWLRFPPHDHPRSDFIDPGHALAWLRNGWRQPAPPPAEVLPCPPEALTEGYDPLGDLSEREWDGRYLVPGERTEYVWPPGERYPEGGCEDGEPVLLGEGTLLDRFGTAHGRVFAGDGTPFARRSLPPAHREAGYRRYRVVREVPMWKAISAGWFAQAGGGERYRSVYSAAELVTLGYLADITFEERA
ncbi:TNT domain-containing protein [Prauserella flavalba]|uniref:DUF4237 domain-containing protein n=1 Tax=Prauserella flavalba TaxID=1477506 RepID=A0A318LS52_9PSEU|nr:TNT domain-containing protein [Prauserella flavalba]PXY37457.1 hypothetical protein BA062_06010 [Prauserella flavalba]